MSKTPDAKLPELLPCPFCQTVPGPPRWHGHGDDGYCEIACDNHECQHPDKFGPERIVCVHGDDEAACVDRWNRREAIRTAAGWIACSERLPIPMTDVLVVIDGDSKLDTRAQITCLAEITPRGMWRVFNTDHGCYETAQPSHWRYLPEAPPSPPDAREDSNEN